MQRDLLDCAGHALNHQALRFGFEQAAHLFEVFLIVGFKAQRISWASGVDGFQAIQLASIKLGLELVNSQEGQVFWNGELDLGLPVLEDTKS